MEFVQKIREAAGDRVEWVHVDEGKISALLIINGCERQCIQKEAYRQAADRVVSIRNDERPPEEILSILMEEGSRHED